MSDKYVQRDDVWLQPIEYGFDWSGARVLRMASLPNGSRVIRVETDYDAVDVYVTAHNRRVKAYRSEPNQTQHLGAERELR